MSATQLYLNAVATKSRRITVSMRASPGRDRKGPTTRVRPKVVVIRLAVFFGLALVTYAWPRGESCPRSADGRRDGRRGGVGHMPRRVEAAELEFFRNLPS